MLTCMYLLFVLLVPGEFGIGLSSGMILIYAIYVFVVFYHSKQYKVSTIVEETEPILNINESITEEET